MSVVAFLIATPRSFAAFLTAGDMGCRARGILSFRWKNGLLAGCALALIATTGGCDNATKPFQGEGLNGEYVLVSIDRWPLPVYDRHWEDTIYSGRIRLWSDLTYEQEDQLGPERESIETGVFFLREERVVLVPEDGRALAYWIGEWIGEGRLLGDVAGGRVYVDASMEMPSEYKYTRYRAVSCAGSPPSVQTPCPGGVIESRIWLGETGTYRLQDQRVDGTRGRLVANYTIADDQIALQRASDGRHLGTYTPTTLMFGGWVYAREE